MSSTHTPTLDTQSSHQEDQGSSSNEPSIRRIRPKDLSGEHKAIDLLDDENWESWHDDIQLTFNVCGLRKYIDGTLPCPNKAQDPIGADNWLFNDDYTKKVIRDRMSRGQKHYVTNCRTSKDMWNNLIAIHQSCSDQTENQIMRELIAVKAQEGDDIKEHLTKIMELWDRMTRICPNNLPMKPPQFKKFLAYSLPSTWDDFTRQHQEKIHLLENGLKVLKMAF